jgi:hypothetical protein
MKREDEAFRMSDSGLEPVAPERRSGRARGGSSGQDKKKVVILIVLAVVGAGLVAYQFLGGSSPNEAAAVTTMSGAAPVADLQDIDAALRGFDGTDTAGAEDLTVARVEELVKKFDSYVAERQVPLTDLRENPFAVTLPRAEAPDQGRPGRGPGPDAGSGAGAAEARAKAQRISDAASRLVLGSVLVAGNSRLAMINGNFCRVGDTVEGFQITAIESDKVRMTSEDVAVDVRLPMSTKGSIKGSPNGR